MDKFSLSLELLVVLVAIFVGQLEGKVNQQQLDYQHDLLPRISSDLAESLKQQQQTSSYQQQENAIMAPKQRYINKEADIEPSLANLMQRLRLKRSSSIAPVPVLSQYPSNQQLFEDEHAIRLQLPDLIAQARLDKNIERALLKMLISASLRSSMTNLAGPYYFNNAPGQILDSESTSDQTNELPRMSARLEQAVDNSYMPGIESRGFNLAELANSQQQYLTTPVDKREYTKPCSFNAVSCAKNPFRKYK